jgi:hypothetical protein
LGESSEKIAKWKVRLHFQHSVFYIRNKRFRKRKGDFNSRESKGNWDNKGFLLKSLYRPVKAQKRFQGITRKRETFKKWLIGLKRWELWFKKSNKSLIKR